MCLFLGWKSFLEKSNIRILLWIVLKTSRPVLADQEIVDHMVKDLEKLESVNSGRLPAQTKTEKDYDDGFDRECK